MRPKHLHDLLVLLWAAVAAAFVAGCGSGEDGGSSSRMTESGAGPVVSASVPVGKDPISAVAAGGGGVWVGGANCPGSVSRIDSGSDRRVARIPVGFVVDVAVGEGAVWALGGICPGGEFPAREKALFRIDSDTNELVATIPLDLGSGRSIPEHLAAGEGGVWIPVQVSPTSGEILRFDPRTNELAARIPVRGAPADIAVGDGAVWALSHPELTEEATGEGRSSSLLRIDPRTNEVAATLAEEKLAVVGGSELPPLMAVGEGEVWVRGEGLSRAAFRIDVRTNEVARERVEDDHFWPFAVVEGGVWFLGSGPTGGALSRLDSNSLEITETVEAGNGLDAAFDPGSRSFWLAEESSVVRVDLP